MAPPLLLHVLQLRATACTCSTAALRCRDVGRAGCNRIYKRSEQVCNTADADDSQWKVVQPYTRDDASDPEYAQSLAHCSTLIDGRTRLCKCLQAPQHGDWTKSGPPKLLPASSCFFRPPRVLQTSKRQQHCLILSIPASALQSCQSSSLQRPEGAHHVALHGSPAMTAGGFCILGLAAPLVLGMALDAGRPPGVTASLQHT